MTRAEPNEAQDESLWARARQSGMSRRAFLALLASGGAAAVLAGCVQKISPTPVATPVPSPAPPPAPRPIIKPIPDAYFIPLGANTEMRFEVMADKAYATPESFFFVRGHSFTPVIDVKTWKLRIEGDGVERPLELSYNDLLKLPAKTVTRFVECAGNGRSFFDTLLKKPAQGGQWRLGAYGVAEWTGVQLSALLKRAGIKGTAVDVMPTGLDSLSIERPMSVAKAMEEDTIVAYMMNGGILPLDHGFPARLITPGWVGINNIKWVGKITVSEKPIFVEKNTSSYVFVGPDYPPQPPAKGPMLTTQVVKSACALPWPAALTAGQQKVVGYAWSPFGKIARVEVSINGGGVFRDARLTGPNIERAGSRWEFSFDARPGDMAITPRATDDKGNVQYAVSQQKWNEQGYLFGAMVPHPVKVVG
ncbi:MAG: sulfite oxidase [Chloroflexi bacterium]|nr:sulfite oxidase [Chloroflexota bacterium]